MLSEYAIVVLKDAAALFAARVRTLQPAWIFIELN
jgi:hypothetical protein